MHKDIVLLARKPEHFQLVKSLANLLELSYSEQLNLKLCMNQV